jgi:hypothetical protein
LEGGGEGQGLEVRVPRPAWTGTMAESTGIRVGPSHEGEPQVLTPQGGGGREGGW